MKRATSQIRRRTAATSFTKAWAALGASFVFSGAAAAQGAPELTFSIDFSGPTIAAPGDPAGTPISDGDLLVRSGGLFDPLRPRIALPAQFLDRYAICGGHAPGLTCGLEVNAISFGKDARLQQQLNYRFNVLFSVDEFARGRQASAGQSASVFSESERREASTDLFFSSFIGVGPFNVAPNAAYADGNGQRAQLGDSGVFGLGLIEPTNRDVGTTDSGDNLDAINYGSAFDPASDSLFFSLEGGFARCAEQGSSFDSAASQTLLGSTVPASSADVLLFVPGSGGVTRYAAAQELGLDLFGTGTDDIDALMVAENGMPGYTAPTTLYDWNAAGGSDLVLFSLRCGSSLIGQPDPVTGSPIGEGDILVKLSGQQLPQVFIPAASLGLRSVAAGDMQNDELNGLDLFDDDEDPFLDCNDNGIDDAIDISYMNSDDVDNNGIPDECEDDWSSVCDCTSAAAAPCGNTSLAGRGCANSTGVGGRLTGGGTTSTFSDALLLLGSDMPVGGFALAFAGITPVSLPFNNGLRCLAPSGPRLGGPIPVAMDGTVTKGPGLIGDFPATLSVTAGSTYLFQLFYRDVGGPCGPDPINTTNALSVTFTP